MNPKSLNKKLLNAALNGDTAEVDKLIGLGADLETQDENGRSSLSLAAGNGHTDTCLFLLDHGAEVQSQDLKKITPLALAALGGHTEACIGLLSRGADIEAKDSHEFTPLAAAAATGKFDTSLALIAHGANASTVLALPEATQFCSSAMLWHLQFPLHPAVRNANVQQCIQLINLGYDIDQKYDRCTPLQRAALAGDTRMGLLLIKHGADMEIRDHNEQSALCIAAANGKTETALALMDQGADVHIKTKGGMTVLMLAAQRGDIILCKAFLQHGVDIQLKDFMGNSALTLAAEAGKSEACQILIDHGADLESLTNTGHCALRLAVFRDYKETVLTLIAAGASIPSMMASSLPITFLPSTHPCVHFPLHEAARRGMTLACVKMLDLGYDLNQKDLYGKTPIDCAGVAHEQTQSAMRSWAARQAARRTMIEMIGAKP